MCGSLASCCNAKNATPATASSSTPLDEEECNEEEEFCPVPVIRFEEPPPVRAEDAFEEDVFAFELMDILIRSWPRDFSPSLAMPAAIFVTMFRSIPAVET